MMTADLLRLAADDVHLWWAEVSERTEPLAWRILDEAGAGAPLDLDGYAFPADRRTRVVARALVQLALSAYAPPPPGGWRFRHGRHGRPRLAGPGDAGLRFNVSHTRSIALCAIAARCAIGVDVDDVRHADGIDDIAERYFAPSEAQALRGVTGSARCERFVALWTLKEAYLKARGTGLAEPLDCAAFRVDERGTVEVTFAPDHRDDRARWRFQLLSLDPWHRVAVARRSRPGADLAVSLRQAWGPS